VVLRASFLPRSFRARGGARCALSAAQRDREGWQRQKIEARRDDIFKAAVLNMRRARRHDKAVIQHRERHTGATPAPV